MGAAPGRRLGDLVGCTVAEVRARLGPPDVERQVGGDRWLLYEADGVRLRIRCRRPGSPAARPARRPGAASPAGSPHAASRAPGAAVRPAAREEAEPRVVSWTATLAEGRPTLRGAAEPLGLWPACAPDAEARAADRPLLRRALRVGGVARSLTARVRGGRIDQITVFDEKPEWEGTGA